jgi:hypothetical protein
LSAVAARAGGDLFSRFDLETSGGRIPAMESLRAYAVLLFLIAERPHFTAQRRKRA